MYKLNPIILNYLKIIINKKKIIKIAKDSYIHMKKKDIYVYKKYFKTIINIFNKVSTTNKKKKNALFSPNKKNILTQKDKKNKKINNISSFKLSKKNKNYYTTPFNPKKFLFS